MCKISPRLAKLVEEKQAQQLHCLTSIYWSTNHIQAVLGLRRSQPTLFRGYEPPHKNIKDNNIEAIELLWAHWLLSFASLVT